MTKIAPALMVGLVLGIALGFVLFGGGGPAEPSNEGQAEARETTESSRLDSAADAAPGRQVMRQPEAAAGLPEAAERRLQPLLADLPRVQSQGSGVIQGVVVDAKGQPLPGVTIRSRKQSAYEPALSDRGAPAPKEETLEEYVQKTAAQFLERSAASREATTGADGSYRLDHLPPGRYSLEAWARGYEVEPRGAGARSVKPGMSVNFRATEVSEVAVLVTYPDGRQAERAVLDISSNSERSNRSITNLWTPEEPVLRLLPGTYEVSASIDRPLADRLGLPNELTSEQQTLHLLDGKDPERLIIQLKTQVGLRGRLLVADDVDFDQCVVRLMLVPPGREPNLALLAQMENHQFVHPSRPEYSFLDLTPGTYVVGVSRNWQGPIVAHAIAQVTDGIVEQDLMLPRPAEKSLLRVLVFDPSGTPLSGVGFQVTTRRRSGTTSLGIGGVEKSPGDYRIALNADNMQALKNLKEGTAEMSIEAETASYGQKSVKLAPGQKEITIRFQEAGTLFATVAGFAGSGLEGRLRLELYRVAKESTRVGMDRNVKSSSTRGRLRADGTQEFGPAEVGSYELALRLSMADRSGRLLIASQTVAIGPGRNVATIAIPPLYPLAIHVPGATNGWAQLLSGAGGPNLSSRLEGETLEFDLLPAGVYDFTVHSTEVSGSMKINVPAQSEVTFREKPIDAARVTVRDESGWFARAGFQSGDLVLAFCGQSFQNEREMNAAMIYCRGKVPATATVLRGGRTLEVPFDFEGMMNSENPGGSFEAATRD